MRWHYLLRPHIAQSIDDTRYIGVLMGGLLDGNVVIRHKKPFFVIVKPEEREMNNHGAIVPEGIVRSGFKTETFEYGRYIWRDQIIGCWFPSGSHSPQGGPPPIGTPEITIFDVEMERDFWCTVWQNRNGHDRDGNDTWEIEVNEIYVEQARQQQLDERWLTYPFSISLPDWRDATHDQLAQTTRTSADSFSMKFDLQPTQVCWKKVSGLECGEESFPDSETGMCKMHHDEVRSHYSKR